MLSGEYSVLFPGGSCVAYCLDKYLKVTIEPINEGIEIVSDFWPTPLRFSTLADLSDSDDMYASAVREAAKEFGVENFKISVDSELGKGGLGSSSALRLGVQAAFETYSQQHASLSDTTVWNAAHKAWKRQSEFQSLASGYDVIAQATGGLLQITTAPESWPGPVRQIACESERLHSFVHIFLGSGFARTKDILMPTLQWLQADGRANTLAQLNLSLQTAILEFLNHQHGSWQNLVTSCANQRQFMKACEFYPQRIDECFADDPTLDRDWSFKLTGAGGDDAIIVFAKPEQLPQVSLRLKSVGRSLLRHSITPKGITLQ